MSSAPVNTLAKTAVLGGDRALGIAQADALGAYQDLSMYRIQLALEEDGWHVDYDLDNDIGQIVAGVGPHYVIDATTGAILEKTYYQ